MWIKVKHSYNSDALSHIGNHCMGMITDNASLEKILVFGGIQNEVLKGSGEGSGGVGAVRSFLSNKCYLVSVCQRSSGKSFFKDSGGDGNQGASQKASKFALKASRK